MTYQNSNIVGLRAHCLRYPQALGLLPSQVKVINGKFVLDPSERNEVKLSTWMRALRTGAWLNQDGRCICGEPLLKDFELHHALITKGDVRGLDHRRWDIHHTYNVMLVHHSCHLNITKEEGFEYLSNLYGTSVAHWYYSFPLKRKVGLADGILS